MAYIESFTVHGLAGRARPVERELDRHINVFWGLNGTGKTSLLKILHSALSNQIRVLERVPFESAEVVFWSTDHQARIRRSIVQASINFEDDGDEDTFVEAVSTLEPLGDGLWKEVEVTNAVRSWTSELLEGTIPSASRTIGGRVVRSGTNAPYRHSYMPISRLTQVGSRYGARRATIDEAALDEDFVQQIRARWQAYNADALATIRAIQQQGLASILAILFGGASGTNYQDQDVVPGEVAFDLVTRFLSEQAISLELGRDSFLDRYASQSTLRAVVGSIEEVTRSVEVALRPQQEFQATIGRLYSGDKALVISSDRTAHGNLRVEVEGSPIPLQSLSSGEKQLLRLLLETLAAESSTVMIDEPELSMHVDWQQVLVESMRRINPECQLLLATHSPEVMADVSEHHVFEL